MVCDADRLLAGCSIDYEQSLLRLQKFLQPFQFLNQCRIDFLPTRGIENVDVEPLPILPFQCRAGGAPNILLTGIGSVNRNFNLLPQCGELFNRGRPLQIARNQSRRVTLLFQKKRQLGRGSRLAGAVETHNQDARRTVEIEWRGVASEQRGQLIMENFHDLLPGRDAAKDRFPERLFPHAANEVLRDLKIDVSLEQSQANLAQRGVDVRFADRAVATQLFENVL